MKQSEFKRNYWMVIKGGCLDLKFTNMALTGRTVMGVLVLPVQSRAYYNNCCSGCIYSFTRTAFVCQMMFSISLIF